MSISLIGKDTANIATTSNPVPVQNYGSNSVSFTQDDFTLDTFNRLRVSEPRIAFEYSFSNGLIAGLWNSAAYGAGTLTQNTTAWTTELSTTTASGTGYWAQTYQHVRYAPGVSTLLRFTFNFTELTSGLVMKIGMFTDQGTFPSATGDGLYLEADGSTIAVVRRTLTSGVGAEERVIQASWNKDKLNGTGTSGVTLDWTKAQHLVIEYQWLGVGTARIGFETGLTGIIWCHEFVSVNVLTTAYSRTGTIPIRAQIHTTAGSAITGKLTLINCVVIQEGDILDYRGWRYFGGNSGATARTIGLPVGLYPLIAIRALLTNDITKRATIIPTKATIVVTTAATTSTVMQWALLALPTPLTGATFAGTAGASSFVGVDQAATASTAVTGTVLATGILQSAIGTYQIDFAEQKDNAIKAGQDAAGALTITGANVLCLAYGPMITASGAGAVCAASINWKELT